MKHFDERRKATESCMQSKVAINQRLHATESCVSMYHCIHALAHTCIIVYTNTCIPGSRHTAQGRRRQGTRRQGAQRGPPAPAQGLITREGAGNFFRSWKLERELEIKSGAGIEAGNKKAN